MIVETIILKSKSTDLEVIARYSESYQYRLNSGESCYAVIVEHGGLEYIICVCKAYRTVCSIADLLTELLCYPLAINRITRIRDGYNIVRDSVCTSAYSKVLQKNNINSSEIFEQYMLDDECEIDFDLTDRVWEKDKT